MRATHTRPGRSGRPWPRLVSLLLVAAVLAGCQATDDGIRVRDRDGAGVRFEDPT